MTISATKVPQYAQGLIVHNPQAKMSSITPRARGNHPKRTSLTVPVGGVPITLEMPPIISMTAEMNKRIAMRVIPKGRLRIVAVTSCRMRSSNREATRSTVDTQKTMRAPISSLHLTSPSQGAQMSSSEREAFSNRFLQACMSSSLMVTDSMRKRNLETPEFCFCFLHDPLNVESLTQGQKRRPIHICGSLFTQQFSGWHPNYLTNAFFYLTDDSLSYARRGSQRLGCKIFKLIKFDP